MNTYTPIIFKRPLLLLIHKRLFSTGFVPSKQATISAKFDINATKQKTNGIKVSHNVQVSLPQFEAKPKSAPLDQETIDKIRQLRESDPRTWTATKIRKQFGLSSNYQVLQISPLNPAVRKTILEENTKKNAKPDIKKWEERITKIEHENWANRHQRGAEVLLNDKILSEKLQTQHKEAEISLYRNRIGEEMEESRLKEADRKIRLKMGKGRGFKWDDYKKK
eukprot:TRINITY_DN2701_c0_g1_i3.p1 TRINITY_DN2701_c0_g1~~TRINITY_DN2701_c0_g1_i3.p1  ORF type:complete len:222 (-),score=43.82 TRINITY_DN2701_c0_g1_i3:720-1385(-)